jgi:hypothetical protein
MRGGGGGGEARSGSWPARDNNIDTICNAAMMRLGTAVTIGGRVGPLIVCNSFRNPSPR